MRRTQYERFQLIELNPSCRIFVLAKWAANSLGMPRRTSWSLDGSHSADQQPRTQFVTVNTEFVTLNT